MASYGYEDYNDTLPISIGSFLAEFGNVIILGLYKISPTRVVVSSLYEQLAILMAEFSSTPLRKTGYPLSPFLILHLLAMAL
jgi:hypothetical protein